MKKAVLLLSGGLDSATLLYWALKRRYQVFPLSFSYGQRHKKELQCARKLSRINSLDLKVIRIEFPWKGSSLLNNALPLPEMDRRDADSPIPSTYVPARNLIFLSFALSYAEAIDASTILIGANCIDFSGYPDCRPQFYRLANRLFVIGTKAGVEGKPVKIVAPLLYLKKSEIVLLGKRLGVPYQFTWSCYAGGRKPCGKCDSCQIRKKGFDEAGFLDPLYQLSLIHI